MLKGMAGLNAVLMGKNASLNSPFVAPALFSNQSTCNQDGTQGETIRWGMKCLIKGFVSEIL